MWIYSNGDDSWILVRTVFISGEEFGFADMTFAYNNNFVDRELIFVKLTFVHYN